MIGCDVVLTEIEKERGDGRSGKRRRGGGMYIKKNKKKKKKRRRRRGSESNTKVVAVIIFTIALQHNDNDDLKDTKAYSLRSELSNSRTFDVDDSV